jgi:hypothetical protein
MNEFAGVMVIVWIVVLVAAVLWILLPFAVFGIKPRLDQILFEARETNALLKALGDQQRVSIDQQKVLLASRSTPTVPRLPSSVPGAHPA